MNVNPTQGGSVFGCVGRALQNLADTAIPDSVPEDVTAAEGWLVVRDILRQALQLPDDQCRAVIARVADDFEAMAHDIVRGAT